MNEPFKQSDIEKAMTFEDIRLLARQATPQPNAPGTPAVTAVAPAEPTCMRVVYSGGNNRHEIYGVSEGELDTKEAQLRAMFGGAR